MGSAAASVETSWAHDVAALRRAPVAADPVEVTLPLRWTAPVRWRGPGLLSLPEPVWRTRHRWVTAVLLVHLPALLAWTLVRQAPPVLVATLAVPTAFYLVAAAEQLSRGRVRVHRVVASCAAAAGLMACSSQLVAVSGGFVEAHFHFFVMVPVVALYEAWAPFSLAVAWVLLEHGVVGTVWPHHVFGHDHDHVEHPWLFAGVHAGFFAAACVGSLTSWTLAERARGVQQGLLEELRHRTLHDDLTGLANRTRLGQELDAALATGAPVAVLALDLDKFKEVNDTLGHSAGDELLKSVAARAAASIPDPGLTVRLGGDEFAVLLPRHDADMAVQVAQRLRQAIGRAVSLVGVSVSTGVSIGVAVRSGVAGSYGPGVVRGTRALRTAEERARTAEALLREADVAMYRAKTSGAGTSLYDAAFDQHTVDRLSGLEDFRAALASDDQVVVHLQPQVSATTGALVGVEALARWAHPTRGLLPTSEFIAMATSPELSEAFTDRVFQAALAQCAAWLDAGRAVPVSVNVTNHCLMRPEFALRLGEALVRWGVPPRLLCLEITEDALVTEPELTASVLATLRRTGVRCSVDDFGTGYSSLSYLSRLPLDELKIDRSFVVNLFPSGLDGPVDDVLVGSIVDLGHRLGLHVVAEGVSHGCELAVLQRLGCDTVQGYLHSPPVAPADFPAELLRTAPAADRPGLRRVTEGSHPAVPGMMAG